MENNKYTAPVFLKFGEEQYMKDLLENGNIYCGNLHWFANQVDEVGRCDSYENIFEIKNAPDLRIAVIDKTTNKIKEILDSEFHLVKKLRDDDLAGNIYCLYTFDFVGTQRCIPIEVDTDKLGEYCVVITDVNKLQERIFNKLKSLERFNTSGFVKYTDLSTYEGKRNPFQKDLKFKNQHEYRFYIHNPNNEAFTFKIDNIEDIAFIIKTSELSTCCLITYDKTERVVGRIPKEIQSLLNNL
ncbi:hypothetical protein [Pedobacter sp. CFBP9032]|uniref:hypothetical protein n=1 Tax=Pedobacter sp. CFBP9032 TaxID=3096539 RepID=UPI002A69B164|nr:hypothetical protein [Pedobacter sp. CFBP9032]MDY0905609.1 hypothetical protein [Pedobacter sp. CFBP9032]